MKFKLNPSRFLLLQSTLPEKPCLVGGIPFTRRVILSSEYSSQTSGWKWSSQITTNMGPQPLQIRWQWYSNAGSYLLTLQVQFIVSSQMTKHDVKNYLEKIYQVNRNKLEIWTISSYHSQVDVADVRTLNKMGKTFRVRNLLLVTCVLLIVNQRNAINYKYLWPCFTFCWIR